MSLHKRANSQNWYYQFQYQGKRYFGSTGTPNKTKALQVEREKRNQLHAQAYLGEAETLTLKQAVDKYLDSRKALSSFKSMQGNARKLFGTKLHFHTLHTLRHSFASKLVRNGVSLYEVSTLLGHSDPKMTQRYAHLAPNDASRKAVMVIDQLAE